MAEIMQLSTHVANMIAAGEVVERPASVAKELLENSVDAGAKNVTIEIQGGGMAFLRVTDDGCGMTPDNARKCFLRHATSKLRTAEDLAAISTMGFRGEALAAIASVSRVDLMTKPAGSLSGTSLHLEAGVILEDTETGCPDGTTIIVRDLFFNTPARMKFMKSDAQESARVTAVVQQQALAHPEVAMKLLRDGKQVLSTPGTGKLQDVMYCLYGRECADMLEVDSTWEGYRVAGFVSKPSQSKPSRSQQTFFVNDRPVKSRLLITALEEAYRNQLMVGKFPACVLHIHLNPNAVDVNVHPAKTEVKFLREKEAFDCVHYGVLAALRKAQDRPAVRFSQPETKPLPPLYKPATPSQTGKKEDFFRTMTAQEYRQAASTLTAPPAPREESARKVLDQMPRQTAMQPLRQPVMYPQSSRSPMPEKPAVGPSAAPAREEPVQEELPQVQEQPWRLVGELYRSYILVEQGQEAWLIDKHAAHERILFEKLKANQEEISSQLLLTPLTLRLPPQESAALLEEEALLEELGFQAEAFGEGTLLLRRVPMDLTPQESAQAVEKMAQDLLRGRREDKSAVRDEVLHTVACKAAIKAGWKSDEQELLALAREVLSRQDLKHCPHGRPICVSLSKKQLEKQFKRT